MGQPTGSTLRQISWLPPKYDPAAMLNVLNDLVSNIEQNKFAAVTGHLHTGEPGQGPLIPIGGAKVSWKQLGSAVLESAYFNNAVSGLTLSNSGGVANLGLATGYVIPTTTEEGNWDTAYGWGNHADAGYLTTLSGHNVSELTNDVPYLTGTDLAGCVLLAGRSGGQTIWGNTDDSTIPEAYNLLLRAALHKSGASPIDVEYGVRIRGDGLPTTGPNTGSITLAAIPTTDNIVHYLPAAAGSDGDLLFNNAGVWDWIGRAYVKVGSAGNADTATAWLGFTSIDSNSLVASGTGDVILGVKVDGTTITASASGLSAQAVTTMHPGTVATLPNDATLYFDGTGNWSIPAGLGNPSIVMYAKEAGSAAFARVAENANASNKWKGMSVLSDMQMILTTQIFN